MTVNERIIQALEQSGLEVTPDFTGGGAKEYITFTFPEERAVLHGNNEPLAVVSEVQIHYFLPIEKNYLKNKKEIRKALFSAGFTYPTVTVLTEPDNKTRHIIFECEIENEYELEE